MEKFKEIRNLQQKIKSLKKKRFLSSMFKVIGKYTTLGIMLSIPVVLWLIAAIVPMSSQVMVGMITGSFLLGLLYVKDNAALLKKITNIFNTDSDLNIDFEIESLNAEIKKLREQKVEVDNRLINNVENKDSQKIKCDTKEKSDLTAYESERLLLKMISRNSKQRAQKIDENILKEINYLGMKDKEEISTYQL